TLEAVPPHQGRMLNQKGAQIGHVALALLKLDKIGSDEGGTWVGGRARPGTLSGALGEVSPGEGAEERAVMEDEGVLLDPFGKRKMRMGERAELLSRLRWRWGSASRQGSAQALEWSSKIE